MSEQINKFIQMISDKDDMTIEEVTQSLIKRGLQAYNVNFAYALVDSSYNVINDNGRFQLVKQ